MPGTQRNPSESYLAYVDRMTKALEDKSISYDDWSKAVLGEVMYSDENTRRCAQFFSRFMDILDKEEIKSLNNDKRVQEIQEQKDELIKERKKLQTENIRLQETYRYQARNDLFNEKIIEAIDNLEPIKINRFVYTDSLAEQLKHTTTGLLCLSDFHAGSTYEVYGYGNEIVNAYNFDIMKDRLCHLLETLEQDKNNHVVSYNELTIALLGDFFDNILRMSSLTKLKEPVIDTVIKFSEFMSKWIAECQERLKVPIHVITVGGNHDVNRILGSKPEFDEENLGKLLVEFMKIRLGECYGITVDNYTDCAICNMHGINVGFVHGADTDLYTALDYFSNLYNMNIDVMYGGHLHSSQAKTVGIHCGCDKECIRVGSICGIDPYAKKIRKSAQPSCYFALYEDCGKTWERKYYL